MNLEDPTTASTTSLSASITEVKEILSSFVWSKSLNTYNTIIVKNSSVENELILLIVLLIVDSLLMCLIEIYGFNLGLYQSSQFHLLNTVFSDRW